MKSIEVSFISMAILGALAYSIGWWQAREDNAKAKSDKIIADKEYREQQEIHKGDC